MLTVDLCVVVGSSLSKSEHTVVDLGHGGAPRLVSDLPGVRSLAYGTMLDGARHTTLVYFF